MTMHESGMVPMQNRDAERALLGSILRDQQIIDEALALIRAEDFYTHGHGLIFREIAELAEKGREIDIVTIGEAITKKGITDDCGGLSYLANLWDCSPSAAHWRHYCEIIRDHAIRRNLARAGGETTQSAFDLGASVPEIVGAAEKRIAEIAEYGVSGESVEFRTALNEAYERIDERRKRKDDISGVPTGFSDLDAILCGFQPSELVIVGARPSQGKTAFAISVACHASLRCEMPTLFVSLEQGRTEIVERMLCMEGRIDSHRLRRGHLSVEDETRLLDAGDVLREAPLLIDDTPMQTMTRISANARRQKRKKGIKLLIVDYIQLIDVEDRRANRQEQVSAISRRLKLLARDLKIPVICLAQLNRGLEDRADKRPRLSDLRESGSLEQDADSVLLLHREEESSDGASWISSVIVGKNRSGPTGDAKIGFDKRFMRFYDFATG